VIVESLDRHVAGGGSARQIIHHVDDSDAQSYARLRRLLAEPLGSQIQGTTRLAGRAVTCWLAWSPEDLERYGLHSETGRYTVSDRLDVYTRHPREHAAQLIETRNA
jgi:hypothetical protein